jgi:hypothetical protein
MRKKIVLLIILCILLAFICIVLYFYRPIHFDFILNDNISITYILPTLENGVANQVVTNYDIKPNTVEYQQLKELFDQYSYHRNLDTIFADTSISGGSQYIYIFTKGFSMTISDISRIILGDKVYRVGYLGSSEIKALNNELLEILSMVEPIPSNQ